MSYYQKKPKEKESTKDILGVIGIGILFGAITVLLHYTVKAAVRIR